MPFVQTSIPLCNLFLQTFPNLVLLFKMLSYTCVQTRAGLWQNKSNGIGLHWSEYMLVFAYSSPFAVLARDEVRPANLGCCFIDTQFANPPNLIFRWPFSTWTRIKQTRTISSRLIYTSLSSEIQIVDFAVDERKRTRGRLRNPLISSDEDVLARVFLSSHQGDWGLYLSLLKHVWIEILLSTDIKCFT